MKSECAVGKHPACPGWDPECVCRLWAGFLPWSPGAALGAGWHVGRHTDALLRSCSSPGNADMPPHPQTLLPLPGMDQHHGPLVFHNHQNLLQNLNRQNTDYWITYVMFKGFYCPTNKRPERRHMCSPVSVSLMTLKILNFSCWSL